MADKFKHLNLIRSFGKYYLYIQDHDTGREGVMHLDNCEFYVNDSKEEEDSFVSDSDETICNIADILHSLPEKFDNPAFTMEDITAAEITIQKAIDAIDFGHEMCHIKHILEGTE